MTGLLQDIRYALRQLRKSPGLTAVAVLILGLGIGINTTFFSALYGLIFQSLPYPNADRLMSVWSKSSSPQLAHFPFMNASVPDYYDWVKQNTTFQSLAAINHEERKLTGAGEPLAVTGLSVTANFFDVLQKPPIIGRNFLPTEIGPGGADVVILSHSLWEQAFGRKADILGRTVTLDNRSYTVVGIAHPDAAFRQDFRAEFYIPLTLDPVSERYKRRLWVIGRLKPNVTEAQALSELKTIAAQLAEQHPDTNKLWSVKLIPLRELLFGDLKQPLIMLYVAAVLVIFISCANLANLLLARGLARSPEMALRSAMGAGRGRLYRQVLAESLLLSLLGGTFGLLVSWWGIHLMRGMVSVFQKSGGIGGITGTAHITVSPLILIFTLVLSVGTTLLFGSLPAWQASQVRPGDALCTSSRGASENRGRRRLSKLLVIGEVSLSFVLVAGFYLLFRSLDYLSHSPLGYDSSHLLTLELKLPSTAPYNEDRNRLTFISEALDRMRAIPGVQYASSVNIHPLSNSNISRGFQIVGRAPSTPDNQPAAEWRGISADYFRTMGISLQQGRLFTPADNGSIRVVIVDQELARRYFPNENPIGHEISVAGQTAEIVGVVGSLQPAKFSDKILRPHMYMPIEQQLFPSVTFMVRTVGDPISVAGGMREAIWSVDRNQPISNVQSMQSLVRNRISMPRLIVVISGLFAFSALTLTLLGVYGIIAYMVHRQTREIGIRIALGAHRTNILHMVLRNGMVLIGMGSSVGLVCALILCRTMSSQLYGISPANPVAYGIAMVLVAGTGLVACSVPAYRAAKVDPMVALRYE